MLAGHVDAPERPPEKSLVAAVNVAAHGSVAMSYASMGSLLPRDFLERQPKRWQKSQRKRRVLPTLRKMKAKREKLETKVYEQAQRDAGIDLKYKPEVHRPGIGEAAEAAPPPQDEPDQPLPSHCTPFGTRSRGLWAAELTPYQPLVVRIPEGVQLWLQRATLKAVGSKPRRDAGADAATSAVRCRTPDRKQPTTLCILTPETDDTCPLNALFTEADRSCAIAVEGTDVVHIVGYYMRPAGGVRGAPPPPPPPVPAPVAQAQKRKAPEEGPVSRPASKAPAPAAAAKAAPALVELSDGLKYHDVKAGKGIKAGPGAKLTVKYAGLAPDPRAKGGWKEFDSNGGKPLHFSLGHGEVIRGWDAGLVGMCQGGTRRLVVPPSMAYGEGGAGPVPPKATLIFEVTLLNVT